MFALMNPLYADDSADLRLSGCQTVSDANGVTTVVFPDGSSAYGWAPRMTKAPLAQVHERGPKTSTALVRYVRPLEAA